MISKPIFVSIVSAAALAVVTFAPTQAGAATYVNTANVNSGEFNPNVSNPYPSAINVAGETGVISKVQVSFNGFTADSPDGLHALLTSPTGGKAMVMRGACGVTNMNGDTLLFDDAAPSLAPINCAGGGSFKPTDNGAFSPAHESLPAPAPAAPYAKTLSTFYGTQPNGTWQLWTRDELIGGTTPSMNGGWTLSITTFSPPPCGGREVTLAGTQGDDTLAGTTGTDVISGLGGDDKITGVQGKDFICGGGGDDTADGGPGKDLLFGNGGNDKLLGKGGKDKLNGGNGDDTCRGGPAKDKVSTCEKGK